MLLTDVIIKDYITFGQVRLASLGTHDKYIQDQPWSSLSIAYYASIMLPGLIDLNYAGRMSKVLVITFWAWSKVQSCMHVQ